MKTPFHWLNYSAAVREKLGESDVSHFGNKHPAQIKSSSGDDMIDSAKLCISVIIPTKNSQDRIEKCLISLINQSYSNYEIIIVDGHSEDNTISRASKFPVRIFYEDGGTRAAACNVGISNAKGAVVAFTDDDCIVPENWLELIAKNFEDPELQVLGGPSVTPKESTSLEKAFGAIYNHVIPLITSKGKAGKNIQGCNSSYRKNAVVAVGGFNEALITTEETELHYRIYQNGGKISYDPNMPVLHYRRATFRSFFKQFYRYGIGKGLMLRNHPKTLGISDVIAYSPFFYLPFSLIILLLNPILGIYFIVVPLLFFIILTFVFSLIIGVVDNGPIHLIFAALIICVVSESLGHFIGLLRKTK